MKITPLRLVVVASLITVFVALFSWWHWVYSNPSRVFDRMLGTMLSTPGLSKHIVQDDQGQKLDQETQFTTFPNQRVRSLSSLEQGANGATTVKTESVGNPSTDFVRYTSIKTDQKSASGKDFNFSSVLNIWGKADITDPASGGPQLFNQTILSVIPSGNISVAQRKELVKEAIDNQVYKIDYSKVKRSILAGRPTYSYDATVQPFAYVTLLKDFAHDIGITQLEQVDPSQYKNSQALSFTLAVDVWSGQLKSVTYKDSHRSEYYGSYGAHLNPSLPTDAISIQALQARLQQVQ